MTTKRFHALIAMLLLACVICPFVEMAVHSNENIFVTGQDGESSVALVLLLLELVFTLASLMVFFVPRVFCRVPFVCSHPLLKSTPGCCIPLSELSPPLSLRI
jgi:hypothetical protein